MPYFRQWKLQPDKVPTPQEQWTCTLQVLFSHLTVELPLVCEVVTEFGRKLKAYFFLTVDHAFPSHRRSTWHEHLPGPLPLVEVNAPPNILFLCHGRLVPFPR